VLPGNPGGAGFYAEFLEMVCQETKDTYRGCVVSHVGHSPPVSTQFGVEDQITSKIEFIKEKLPADTPVTLVGHSFGCYIALQIMDRGIDIERSILLFPMIQDMAKTEKAKSLYTMLLFRQGLVFLSYVITILPSKLRGKIIQFYTELIAQKQDHITSAVCELIDPSSIDNIFSLAENELEVIKDMDYEIVKRFKDRLVFYYGMFDLWGPLEFYREMKKHVPGINAHIADDDILHTFMFHSAKKVAVKTAEFLAPVPAEYQHDNLILDEDENYDFCDD